jgi:hypothetical protein
MDRSSDADFGAFSASIRSVNPNHPKPDPKRPPTDLNLPVFMGPMTLPTQPQSSGKRRLGRLVLWSILVFAGGAAAGTILIDQTCSALDGVTSMLGLPTPRFVVKRRLAAAAPAAASVSVTDRAVAPVPPSVPAPAPAPAPTPVVEVKPEPEQPAAAPARREPAAAKQPVAAAPAPAEVAVAEPAVSHPQHGKGAAKAPSAAGPPTHKGSNYQDPFAVDDDRANAAKAAAPSGKPKPAQAEPAAVAKSEPAPKPVTAKSHDSLDNLMADGVADSKGKKKESKDIDALLKDVQKKPDPAPKHEAPPPAVALSPADISKVMAGVKTRSSQCAQRLGQKGIAELKITVSREGAVTDVHVGGKIADTPLAACVEKATRAATFPASTGLKFDYRVDAR